MVSAGGYFVRTVGRRDLPAVRALLIETWHHTYDAIYGADRVVEITTKRHGLEALEARLAQPNAEFVVADNGKQIGGVAFAVATDEGKVVMLKQLYVRPACQGRGIGAVLLAEIEESFPEAGEIRLEVEEANQGARAFYEAHGFVRVGQTGNCGEASSGIPALVYGKSF